MTNRQRGSAAGLLTGFRPEIGSHSCRREDVYKRQLLTHLPMNPDVARLCDEGEIERVVCEEMEPAADAVERLLKE